MLHTRLSGLLLSLISIAVTIAGCGDGGSDSSPTPFPSPEPTPVDAAAIRDIDFSQLAAFQMLMRQAGGSAYDRRAVLYVDLTGDGREEAVVPIASGGTLGNLAYQVYTLSAGTPVAILTAIRDQNTVGGLVMSVEDGKLVRTAARYGPSDPLCCPSALVKTYYRWDGSSLQIERDVEVQATPGPKQ